MAVVELAAVRQVAEALFPGAEALSRFSGFYALARSVESRHLTATVGSPYRFAWLKRIFDFNDADRGDLPWGNGAAHPAPGQDRGRYLGELLDRFGLLVAAAMIQQRASHVFVEPVRILSPSTLPATVIHIIPEAGGGGITEIRAGEPIVRNATTVSLKRVEVEGRSIQCPEVLREVAMAYSATRTPDGRFGYARADLKGTSDGRMFRALGQGDTARTVDGTVLEIRRDGRPVGSCRSANLRLFVAEPTTITEATS